MHAFIFLAHESYRSGTAAHRKIIETFGEDILDLTTNEIDRRRLGAKVFGQPVESLIS